MVSYAAFKRKESVLTGMEIHMKQRKQTAGIRRFSVLATSLIAATAINTAAALTKVDVLVAYDTTASAWLTANSKTATDFAAEQVDNMNTVLTNSGLGDTFAFRCVGVHDGAFTYATSIGFDGFLQNAVEGTDDAWKALRNARDSYGADIVMLLVDTGTTAGHVGHSKSMAPAVSKDGAAPERKWNLDFEGVDEYLKWFAEQAYGVCNIRSVSSQDDYTMAHEAGHIMGAGHSDILHSDPGPQLFTYSAAYMYDGSDGNSYATVMGYNSNGSGDGKTYEVLPYFSSPDLKNPKTDEPLGDADHDNVTTLKNTYAIVAAFRPTKVSDDSGTTPDDQSAADSTPDEQQQPTINPVPQRPSVPSGAFVQKTLISGVVKDGSNIVGVIHFTVAKTSKGYSKVSGSFIGLDGKKKSVKAGKCPVEGGTLAKVYVESAIVKDYDGVLRVVLGEDGSIADGSLGDLTVENASSIGVLDSAAPVFTIDEPILSSDLDFIDELTYEDKKYFPLPYAGHGEAMYATSDKWATSAKAGKLKLKNGELIPDMGKDGSKTNLSGLKVSFAKKTASFKGSFNVYAVVNSKLKKFKFVVTGVVADGVGKGTAFCKKLDSTSPVSVSVQ